MEYIFDLNKQMTNIGMVTGQNQNQLANMASKFNDMAKEFGVTTLTVAEGATEFIRQGKTVAETNELLRNSIMMGKLGNIEAKDATDKLIAVTNAYNISAKDSIKVVDVLVSLDNKFATSTAEIASAMQKSSSMAKLAGVSYQDLASYITVISATTRQSGETIGQALKTVFARMEQVKAGAKIDEEGEAINNVEKVLLTQGIRLRDNNEQFRDMSDVLQDVAVKYKELGKQGKDVEQQQIIGAIAGVRQANMLSALFDQWDQVGKAQTAAADAGGIATERYKIYMQGLEATLNKFKATWEELWSTTVSGDFIKGLVEFGAKTIQLVTNLGGLVPVLLAIGAALIVIKAQSMSGSIVQILTYIPRLIVMLNLWRQGMLGVAGANMAAASAQALVTGGISILVAGLVLLIANADKLGNSMNNLNRRLQENYDITTENVNELNSLISEYEQLSSKSNKSADDMARLLDIQTILNTKYGYSTDGINSYTAAIDGNSIAIEENIAWMKKRAELEATEFLEKNKSSYETGKEFLKTIQTRSWGTGYVTGTPEEILSQARKDYSEGMGNRTSINLTIDQLDEEIRAAQELVINYEHYNNVLKANSDITRDAERTRTANILAMSQENQETKESIPLLEELTDASDELGKITKEATSSAISGYETLRSVLESYNDTNVVTINQAQKLIDAGYGEAVSINQLTGEVSINTQMLRQLAIAKADAAITALQNQLAIWQETTAIESQEKDLINNINLWRQRKAAIKGSAINTVDLLKAISSFSGGVAKVASGSSSAIDKLTESRKKSYETEIKGYEAQKKALDNQKKDLEAQKDAYKDIIDAMKEKLRIQKEESDFQNELEDKNKELADIENELFAIQFDNSQEAKAKRLKLEEDKAEKIEEITQFQADRTYDIQIEALDAEYEAYARMIDQQLAGIDAIISGFDAMIAKINELIDTLSKLSDSSSGSGGFGSAVQSDISKIISKTLPLKPSQMKRYGYLFHDGGLVESHHDGDFAGSLKSNEVFSKLLKGEYVSTEAQMKNFLSDILPRMMIGSNAMIQNKSGNGDISINMPITIEGNADESLLPKIKNMVSEVIYEGMKNKGYRRNVNSYGNV
jgi:TP901 family phage tail tape measure protein